MHFRKGSRINCDKWTKNGCGGLKRFIRYLYEYQQGQRIRNVGFVKVEQEDDSCVVHIHGKGLKLTGDRELKLYLFFTRDNACMGVYQGSIDNVNPAVNYRLAFCKEDTGGAENYALVDGIIMENNSRRKFAAVWNDMPVDVDHMKIWVPQAEEMPDMQAESTEDNCECKEEQEEMQGEMQTAPMQEEPERMPDPDMDSSVHGERIRVSMEEQEPAVPQESIYGMSAAVQGTVTESTRDVYEACDDEDTDGEDDGYVKPSRTQYSKIQRQQLSRLPRCEWRLANNSFLLHGYYNYHHLMLIDEGDVLWLGVPGVYHEREARAAEAFGFPRFIRISEDEMEWGKEERNTSDDFGYWCRKVRR